MRVPFAGFVTYSLTMSVELAVSVISAVVALGSVLLTILLGARAAAGQMQLQAEIDQQRAARAKQEDRQELMNRLRDPVLWAAFDLQSRIYNIVLQRFFLVYLVHGSDSQPPNPHPPTVFLFPHHFACA